ncbi:hypothetical protein [Haloferax sulfurifontis]|uniref:hypothetical protein n=1 Tax=Haloferax sulfurifontis TaxID=255616 RepID=UPI001667023F|nr:hypothetical protein [Haloferax sulfurifontis]
MDILEGGQLADREFIKNADVKKCDEKVFLRKEARHFEAGTSAIAAISLSSEFDTATFCVSDSQEVQEAFETAGVDYWNTVYVGAHLMDQGTMDFEETQRVIGELRDEIDSIPPNYTALLRKETASSPV